MRPSADREQALRRWCALGRTTRSGAGPFAGASVAAPALLVLVLVLVLVLPMIAAAQEPGGWRGARFGMTAEELRGVLGARLSDLPGRWEYGGAYAELAIFDVALGGLAFDAFFQMNERTDRLQQILLERRRGSATPEAFEAVTTALENRYGPADRFCLVPNAGGTTLLAEMVWTVGPTTVHATFSDFRTLNPGLELSPTLPPPGAREAVRRSAPRRVAVRFHPAERTDLLSRLECVPIEASGAAVGP